MVFMVTLYYETRCTLRMFLRNNEHLVQKYFFGKTSLSLVKSSWIFKSVTFGTLKQTKKVFDLFYLKIVYGSRVLTIYCTKYIDLCIDMANEHSLIPYSRF